MPTPLPPGEPDTSPEAIRAQLKRLLLVRLGTACFALLAGLSCYYGALYFSLTKTVALFAAVIFAALVWIAARSLFRDFQAEARRRRANSNDRQH